MGFATYKGLCFKLILVITVTYDYTTSLYIATLKSYKTNDEIHLKLSSNSIRPVVVQLYTFVTMGGCAKLEPNFL